MGFRRNNLKVRTRYNILNFPALFQHWQSSNNGPAGRMAGLPVLKKCGKIQNVLLSSDFEIFSPEIHALIQNRIPESKVKDRILEWNDLLRDIVVLREH